MPRLDDYKTAGLGEMRQVKILIGEPIAQEAVAQMQSGGAQVDSLAQLGGGSPEEIIGQYEGLVVGQMLQVDEALLARAEKLAVIGKIGKDTSNIDLAAATRAGVAVVNTSQGVSASLAEYNILAMLTLARLETGNGQLGRELKGKTLGIIGLGNVGAQVAKRAKAFDMRVICYDPSVSRARAMVCEVELMDLVDLLVLSDFITIHVPLNDETRGLINHDNLSLMRQGAYLVNTAEPEVCDLDAVVQALASGRLGGVAMDFPSGHESARQKLAASPRAIVTENQAAATAEARVGTAQEVVAEMLTYCQTLYSKNAINIPLLKESQRQAMQGFRRLALTLGDFTGQLVKGPLEAICMTYRGDIAAYDEAPLTQWALMALLGHVTADKINYVNALAWAKEQGISVTVQQDEACSDYQSVMSIEVTDGGETKLIAGQVRSGGEIRLIQMDDFTMDTQPEPHFLLIPHENKPGMIGKVGMVLGHYDVNISAMVVGRQQAKDHQAAMMVMTIAQPVTDEVLKALEATEGVHTVQSIDLKLR